MLQLKESLSRKATAKNFQQNSLLHLSGSGAADNVRTLAHHRMPLKMGQDEPIMSFLETGHDKFLGEPTQNCSMVNLLPPFGSSIIEVITREEFQTEQTELWTQLVSNLQTFLNSLELKILCQGGGQEDAPPRHTDRTKNKQIVSGIH